MGIEDENGNEVSLEVQPYEPKVTLPAAVAEYLLESYRNANSILEYGSGGSTVMAVRESKANVVSVESDRAWARNLADFLTLNNLNREGVEIVVEDIGPTKKWGFPAKFNKWSSYYNYPTGVWTRNPNFNPDVVLVDGRFRTACVAAVMLNCKNPTKLIFDDYIDRPKYHRVEKYVPLKQMVDRAGVFEIEPRRYTNEEFQDLLSWFFVIQ